MRIATGGTEFLHLVVKRLPVPGQDVAAGNHDVDLVRAGLHAFADLGHAQVERRQTGGKPGGDCCDGNAGALKCFDGGRDHVVVDADRACGDPLDAQFLHDVVAHGLAGLGAEAAHPPLGIVTGQGGQVDAGDRLQQPGGLVILLDRPAPRKGARAAFDGAAIGLCRQHPIEVQILAGIARLDHLGKLRCHVVDLALHPLLRASGLGRAQGRTAPKPWQARRKGSVGCAENRRPVVLVANGSQMA